MSKKEYSVTVVGADLSPTIYVKSTKLMLAIEYIDILNSEQNTKKFFAKIQLEKITRDKCKACKYFIICKLPVFNYKNMVKKLHVKILQNIEEEYFKKYCNNIEKITNKENFLNELRKKERFAFAIDDEE